jgi:hypothetical protein
VASRKTEAGQSIFIPSTSDQFLEMLRSFKILLCFIKEKKSAIYLQSKELHANFKKVKINLRDFFMTHKENGGQYLCLIIYNLTFNMLNHHLKNQAKCKSPPDGLFDHLTSIIPIPTNKPPAFLRAVEKNTTKKEVLSLQDQNSETKESSILSSISTEMEISSKNSSNMAHPTFSKKERNKPKMNDLQTLQQQSFKETTTLLEEKKNY